jgi:hypothetical protein
MPKKKTCTLNMRSGRTLEREGVSRPARICTGREYANFRVPTRDHRTVAACAYNLDRVTDGSQLGAGVLGDTWLDAQHTGLVRMWPERVDDGFRCEARRLDRLLGIHAEHKHVEDDLKIRLALIIAARTSYRRATGRPRSQIR